jgi:hypothetical protein
MTEGRLVTLTVYYSVLEAKMCVSMLEGYGIYAFAPTEMLGNAPQFMTAFGGIEIKVVERDLDAAKALLADVQANAGTDEEPQPRSGWRILWNAVTGTVSTLLFGVPPAPAPPKSQPGKLRKSDARLKGES